MVIDPFLSYLHKKLYKNYVTYVAMWFKRPYFFKIVIVFRPFSGIVLKTMSQIGVETPKALSCCW